MKHSANIGNSKSVDHRPDTTRSSKRALTLLEVVISLAIMAVVFATVLPQFRNINNSWASKQGAAEALQNGRVLTDHIYRNLMKGVRITAVSDPAETNGYIEFEDDEGNPQRYDINASNYVEFGPPGNLSELAGPASKLQFTCYDASGGGTPTTDVDSIRLVKVDTTLTNSAALGDDKTFSTAAYLRTNWYSPPTPIGGWKLDEGSGQIAEDSSGDTNDGQLGHNPGADPGDPTWWDDSTRGNVLDFDGHHEHITEIGKCPDNDAFTVAAWAKDTGPISFGIRSTVYSAEQEIWLGVYRGASACICVDVGGSDNGAYTALGTWTRHVWHHLAATWDGSTVHIYLDGVDMPITTYGAPNDPKAKDATIGVRSEDFRIEEWYGLLSDVCLYDEALTEKEIVTLGEYGWEMAP